MHKPRFYGNPTAKAAKVIQSRAGMELALRANDTKSVFGFGDTDGEENPMGTDWGFVNITPGVQTNRFYGYSDYLAAGTKKVWASGKAIDIIANVVLSTEMKVVNRDETKNKRGIAVKVPPELARLLENPNPYDTISEMLYLWTAHIKFTGNAFWFKDEMNGYGQPKNIYWINPRFMRIVPDKDLRVGKYIYRINNVDIEFTPDEIIHFRRPHANDALWGLGDIENGESLYDDHINRSLYNVRLMANGAFPSKILVREDEPADQEEWSRNKSRFNDQYGGAKNAGKTAFMTGKWSMLHMGLDASSMQELEKHNANIEHIFMNHGVPLSVAGFSNRVNFATARQDDINFRKYTCLPLVNLFIDAINSPRGFISAFNQDAMLDFSLSGLIDVEQVMKDYGPAFDRGCMTNNELREVIGLPKRNDPFMDQVWMPNTMVPIEIAGIANDSSAAPPAPGTPGGPPAKPKPGQPVDAVQGGADDHNPSEGGNRATRP